MDKMDQTKTNIPFVHTLRSTPLMRTGHVMVIGLVGCVWTGTPQDDLTVTTLWEDGKHGGNSQSSLILKNLHAKVCQSQVCPESLIISADNTPKETKNGITYLCSSVGFCVP